MCVFLFLFSFGLGSNIMCRPMDGVLNIFPDNVISCLKYLQRKTVFVLPCFVLFCFFMSFSVGFFLSFVGYIPPPPGEPGRGTDLKRGYRDVRP